MTCGLVHASYSFPKIMAGCETDFLYILFGPVLVYVQHPEIQET